MKRFRKVSGLSSSPFLDRKLHKYHAKETLVDGIKFPSKLEATRYVELKTMARAGIISEFRHWVTYKLYVHDLLICKYIADFVYLDEAGATVVEDAKGVITPEFRLKKKLMWACLGIDVKLWPERKKR